MKHNKVKSIHDFGQSIWLDFFDRKIMNSGKLKKLIEDDGVSGVTSNPSIFEKAISSSSDYDEDITALAQQKSSNEEFFLALQLKILNVPRIFLNRFMRKPMAKMVLSASKFRLILPMIQKEPLSRQENYGKPLTEKM